MKSKSHDLQNKYVKMSKQKIILCITLLISMSSFAQQGINYKANLKDVNGNVLAGTYMTVQFTIHQSTAMGTIVYQEDHNYTTDANGLLILNIGTDASPTIGVFSDIDWSIDQHFLQTTINYSGGTVNFDATEFMAVPYANHAQTAAIADNVFSGDYNDLTNQPTTLPTGLEKITDSIDSGTGYPIYGWRLVGTEPENYGNIGKDAVDLSYSNSILPRGPRGATGIYSTAMGYETTASGVRSTAMGYYTLASERNSTAMGGSTAASGDYSTAMGGSTAASGKFSTAMGRVTVASGDYSTAMGRYTVASGDYSTAMGRYTAASGKRSTAMGTFTAASGSISTAMGGSTNASGSFSTAMGQHTTAPSYAETAIGSYNTIYTQTDSIAWRSNDRVFVIGNGTQFIRNDALTVLKNGTITAPSLSITEINAAGDKALITKEYFEANDSSELEAIDEGNGVGWRLKGVNATYYDNIGNKAVDLTNSSSSSNNGASGDYSFASGAISSAKGDYSTAMGLGTIALRISSVAIGKYNIENSSAIFSVGNGNAANARNTAMTVLDDGKVGIGRDTPTSLFEVAHQNGTPTSSNRTNAFSIRNLGTGRSWQFYTHPTGYLELYNDGSHRGSFNPSSGVYSTVSDRRLKKDITSLENGTLNKVMQLNPVSYLMKDQTDPHRNLGLISQEVQELFPSLTHYVKESDLLTLSYTELIPVLIKALQEQQVIIETQKTKDVAQDKSIEALVARLNILDQNSSN